MMHGQTQIKYAIPCFQAHSRLLKSAYYCRNVRSSVCISYCISAASTGRIHVKFDIRDFY